MASSSSPYYLLLLFSLLHPLLSLSSATTPPALIIPVTKDASTLQYVTRIHHRTPLVPVKLVVDLGGRFMWVDCDRAYVSSSYLPAHCDSAPCKAAKTSTCGTCFAGPKPGCNNNTCGHFPGNPFTRSSTGGELALDALSLQSTDGSNPRSIATVPRFIFTCGTTSLLDGLARGSGGMAGLGRTGISMPTQLAEAFKFPRKFAMCLSSSTSSDGVIFFGNGPYNLLPGVEASKSLIYTPLFINPVSTAGVYSKGDKSAEYFIGVSSIKINGKNVPLNSTLLSIDRQGNGGTKISTVDRYTILETSIYKAVTGAWLREFKVSRVAAVAPFKVCYDSKNIVSTRVGPAVPPIDLVLQESVSWRIFGANSMVEVKPGVLCLGFVDGGVNSRTSIVIGGHQLEDNLLEFDLAKSRLGFSSTLLFRQTTCANFNFTSKA